MAYGFQYVPSEERSTPSMTREDEEFEQAVSVMMAAKQESKEGHTVHVNRNASGAYYVDHWYDGSTVVSYYNGRTLATAGNGEMLADAVELREAATK